MFNSRDKKHKILVDNLQVKNIFSGNKSNHRKVLGIYRRYRLILIILFIIVIFIFLVFTELVFKPFSITEIEEVGITLSDDQKAKIMEQKLYLINSNQITNLLLEDFLEIDNFQIKKQYPNKITLVANKREGVFKREVDNGFYIIDKNGVVFEKVTTSDLPTLPISIDEMDLGTIINANTFDFYQDVAAKLKDIGLNVGDLKIEGKNVIASIESDRYKIILSLDSYSNEIELLKHAIEVTRERTSALKLIKFIDNKIVLEYET